MQVREHLQGHPQQHHLLKLGHPQQLANSAFLFGCLDLAPVYVADGATMSAYALTFNICAAILIGVRVCVCVYVFVFVVFWCVVRAVGCLRFSVYAANPRER